MREWMIVISVVGTMAAAMGTVTAGTVGMRMIRVIVLIINVICFMYWAMM